MRIKATSLGKKVYCLETSVSKKCKKVDGREKLLMVENFASRKSFRLNFWEKSEFLKICELNEKLHEKISLAWGT